MQALVLAAGYGTRLGRLGAEHPKALLPVGGRPLLDHFVDRLVELGSVEALHLVTNHRFVDRFDAWRSGRDLPFRLTILDDGTTRPEEKLGAVGDLALAVRSLDLGAETLVAGSDNVFDFSVGGLVRRLRERRDAAAAVTVVEEDDVHRLRTSGVPRLAADGTVLSFQEKPDEPPSRLLVPPLYLFRRRGLLAVGTYLEQGGEPDAPGHFLSWLVERETVVGWTAPGGRFDVGTPERYEEVRRRFGEGAGSGPS